MEQCMFTTELQNVKRGRIPRRIFFKEKLGYAGFLKKLQTLPQ